MNQLNIDIKNQLLEAMLNGSKVATVVTDPLREGNPIIYSNETFNELTGYTNQELLGRNCRFLQGDDTNQRVVDEVREAIANRTSVSVTLENYRKDGSRFWNRLQIEPVWVENQIFFIGTQTDITHEVNQQHLIEEKEEELNEQLLPILPIGDNIGAVALVGTMTNRRFSLLTSKLSFFVQDTSTEHIIIDVTGVIWEKEFLYVKLMMIQDVLRLMGSKLYITGINPETAFEIVKIQDYDQSLLTFSTVQQVMHRLTANTPG